MALSVGIMKQKAIGIVIGIIRVVEQRGYWHLCSDNIVPILCSGIGIECNIGVALAAVVSKQLFLLQHLVSVLTYAKINLNSYLAVLFDQ